MTEINLLPEVKRDYLKVKRTRNAVVSLSITVCIVVTGLAVVLGLAVSAQLLTSRLQNNTIETESKRLASIDDVNEIVTIQHQLRAIDDQQNARTIDSRLFDVMSAINPPAPNNVRISTIKMDPAEKTIFIEGSVDNGYIALEIFKKTIANTAVHTRHDDVDSKVQLATDMQSGTTSFGEDAEGRKVLRFLFTFTYPEELFIRSHYPVSIVTPQGRMDVTDSRLGVPQSLFGPRARDANGGGE